jgi:osmotically-inducible protein OsmY
VLRFVNPLRAEARAISQPGEDDMRKPFHLLVFVLVLALAYATAQTSGSSPSTSNQSQPSQDQTQTQPQKPDTQTGSSATAMSSTDVQNQIQDALKKDPTLSSSNITVAVTDDAVELTGTCASADDKRAAKKIARTYAGTRKIKDSLTVSGTPKSMPPKGMGFVSAGTYMQSQSAQPQSSQSGNTTGTTQSPSTSQSPPTEPSSSQQAPGTTAAAGGDVQMQIQNALQKEPTLSNDSITVAVSDDAIELNGTVATSKEKQTAKRIAQSYAGNRKIKDHLTVSASNQGPDKSTTNPPPGSVSNPSNLPDTTNPSTKPPSSAKPPRR